MLLAFRARNFRSLRDEQELSLIADSTDEPEQSLLQVPKSKLKAVRSSAIYGGNASGKTNVLQAISFVDRAVEDSHRAWESGGPIPITQFALEGSRSTTSSFEIDFVVDDQQFQYGFSLDPARIHEEWLYAFPFGKHQLWFKRQQGRSFEFGRKLVGTNKSIEALVRDNSLYLSAAAQNNHEQLTKIYRWFKDNFFMLKPAAQGAGTIHTARLCQDEASRKAVTDLLRFADLGIADIKIVETELDEKLLKVANVIAREMNEPLPANFGKGLPQLSFSHKGMNGDRYSISSEDESNGTMALFSMLHKVLRALKNGSVLLIDELDASLHPNLARQLVALFNNPETNPHGAQFIFTTHNVDLIDPELLRKDQIWLVEKSVEGRSRLYPLTDFSTRKDQNIRRGYLQGRFGAVPILDPLLIPTTDAQEPRRTHMKE